MRKVLTLILVSVCLLLSLLACAPRVEIRPASFSVHFIGTSMEPTIHNGQFGIEQPYAFDEAPQRGDIIGFVAPPEPTKNYCKRIIGLPGDIISVDNTVIRLNGVRLFEPYVSPYLQGNPSPYPHILAIVPAGEVFVLGDNRSVSFDSRFFGFVPEKNIVGRIAALYDPPSAQPVPVADESGVFAQAAKQHLKGAFFTGWSGYYITGNAALLFLASPSFPIVFASKFRKRIKKMGATSQQPIPQRTHGRTAWYRLRSRVSVVVLLLLLCSCSLILPKAYRLPTRIEQPLSAQFQPFRSVQLCVDSPPLYPARFAREAAAALADRIDSAVNVNFGGLVVYVSYITSDSFQNAAMQFSIPAFPADPAAPQQPKLGNDPYQNADMQLAYQKAFARWQEALISQHHKLALLRAQVKQWTDKLRSLHVPYDPTGADPWGCLDDASQHFQGVTGEKYLLIASPLLSTTTLQKRDNISLAGVTVKIVWHPCVPKVASTCLANDAAWKHRLLHFGARSVTFEDVPQSQVEKPAF